MLEVRLLGQFDVRAGEVQINIPTLPARFLFAYLLLNRNHPQSREKLAGLFWPDTSDANARNNLRQTIWRIRKAFESYQTVGAQFLVADDLTIGINDRADIWLDTALLDEPAETADSLMAAVTVYRGELLPQAHDDWVVVEREYYEAVFNEKMRLLMDLLVEEQRWREVVLWAERWLTLGRAPEPAYRALMYAHAGLGNVSQVAVVYRRCKEALRRELDVEPSEQTTALHDRLIKDKSSLRGYQLRELISKNEASELYRAYQPLLDREVAVKVIAPRYANQPDFIRRFELEAQLIARLEHIHIRPLYDYWRDPAGAYLVMRWLNGGNLGDLLRGRPLPLPDVARLLDHLASGLATAHRRDIIHGDLKPENILFDEEGNAFLTDFRIAIDGGSIPGAATFHFPYAAPEQVRGEAATPLSDQYGLALILYEAVTGQRPFSGDKSSPAQPDGPALAHLEALGLSSEATAVFQRALSPTPADRFADVPALADALHRALEVGQAARESAAQELELVLEPPNPYKGLRAFQEADAADFFGREGLIERILERLDEPDNAERFLAIVGPSGSGKSSVIHAGLLPALRRGALPGSEDWFIVDFSLGAKPLDDLEIDLLHIATYEPANLGQQLRQDEKGLLRAVSQVLPGQDSELLLIIDHFEELFIQVENRSEIEATLAMLYSAATDPESKVRVVVALRADYYDRPLMYPAFGELMRRHTEVVVAMSADELWQAIAKPAERAGIGIESGLPTRIVADLKEQNSVLPLLQYALTELFEHRQGQLLTRQAYDAIGGVAGALARRAETVYGGLTAQERAAAKQLLLRMVDWDGSSRSALRRVPLSELQSIARGGARLPYHARASNGEAWEPDALGFATDVGHTRGKTILDQEVIDVVLQEFNRSRLLTFDHDPGTREPTVEVAHEALLLEWRRLRLWLEDNRHDLRMRRLLAGATQEWLQAERDPDFLLRGKRLAQLGSWAAETEMILTADERGFLDAGLEARRARQAAESARRMLEAETQRELEAANRQRRRRDRILAVAGVASLLLIALASSFYLIAREQARVALSGQLAAECLKIRHEQFERAALLCVEALRFADTWEARNALATVFTENPQLVRSLHGHQSSVTSIAFNRDSSMLATGSTDGSIFVWDMVTWERIGALPSSGADRIVNFAFGPSDEVLVLAGADGSVTIWDLATGRTNRVPVFDGEVISAAFSADQKALALGSADGRILRWDIESLQPAGAVLQAHMGAVVALAFSGDGSSLASAGQDDLLQVWELDTGIPKGLDSQSIRITAIEYSPDSRYLAATGSDGTIIILDLHSEQAVRAMVGDYGRATAITFSLDGKRLASGHADGSIRFWDARNGRLLGQERSGHTGTVRALSYSPNGEILVSGSADRDIILRRVAPGQAVHSGALTSVQFRPDGQILATSSIDGNVQFWSTRLLENDGRLHSGPRGGVYAIAYSPDGQSIAVAARDGTITLFDVVTQQVKATLSGHKAFVTSVAFRPDGRKLASASADKSVILWDIGTARPSSSLLQGHEDWVLSVAFSPDGKLLASAGRDKKIVLWNVEQGERAGPQLEGHLDWVYGLAFSPDGRWLASSGADSMVYLWDLDQAPPAPLPLRGHRDYVFDVLFSPDGKLLISGGADGTIRFWDVETGQSLGQPLAAHVGAVYSVDSSLNGEWLASGGQDATFQLWRLNMPAWVCEAVGRNLSRDEWEVVFQDFAVPSALLDLSFHQTCPG